MSEPEQPATVFARGLAAQRRRVAHECVVCGAPFVGVVQAKYCSQRCSLKADYRRHAAERRRDRLARYHARKAAATE